MSSVDHLDRAIAALNVLIVASKSGTLTPEMRQELHGYVIQEVTTAAQADLLPDPEPAQQPNTFWTRPREIA